ncbi:MAG TPA: DUF1345 domain-containing protein [Acidimicrobiales bacterium]|nr:DUF1345 domain-containing protein [Acidimicrobiales bacterium]
MQQGGFTRRLATVPAAGRVAFSMAIGLAVGLAVSLVTFWQAAALIGWDAATVVFLLSVWVAIGGMAPADVRDHAGREDPRAPLADLVVLATCVAFLAAVALALAKAGDAHGGTKAYLVAVSVVSVALSWLQVHTVFTLRYARLYYATPVGGVDFNEPDPPAYLDFAYLAFTIGMTFQVSDTNLTAKPVRRLALRHALLSFVFGAVILGLAINVVASILGR